MALLASLRVRASNMWVYSRCFGLRGCWYALRAKREGDTWREVSGPGNAGKIWLRLNSVDVHTLYQVFVKREYALHLTQEPQVIIDLGANIGLSSLFFAQRYPNARIIAVEPERENFELLPANTQMLPRVSALRAAVGPLSGMLTLVDPGLGTWGYRAISGNDEGFPVVDTVRSVTIPEILKEYHVERVGLLKVDIEGAEHDLFESSTDWMGLVDVCVAELHDHLVPGCSVSFGAATEEDFHTRWQRGELVMVSRAGMASPE